MHEATLAENILNIAFDAAKDKKIYKIGLTLGGNVTLHPVGVLFAAK